MHPRTTFALAALLVLLVAPRALSQGFNITFDENGHGTVQPLHGGPVFPLISLGKGVDPVDPGNGKPPLIYDLRNSVLNGSSPILPGDIDLTESLIPEVPPGDLLRFTPSGLLVVYSKLPEPGETPSLADVGVPLTGRQSNRLIFQESGAPGGPQGLFGYQPTNTQPGYLTGTDAAFAVYNFYSEIPEPAGMMACAVFLGAISRRSVRSFGRAR